MSKTEHSSTRRTLSVEDLLKLKRAERPSPEFWVRFERDLQRKQLQALVRPSWWRRIGGFFVAPRFSWRIVSAAVAGGAILAVGAFSFFSVFDGFEAEPEEFVSREVEVVEFAAIASEIEPEPSVEALPVRSGGALFVVDAIRPEESGVETFRTVATPETWVGRRTGSASYVVNTLTTNREQATGRTLRRDF